MNNKKCEDVKYANEKEIHFEPGIRISMKLPLRRTLVRSELYGATSLKLQAASKKSTGLKFGTKAHSYSTVQECDARNDATRIKCRDQKNYSS